MTSDRLDWAQEAAPAGLALEPELRLTLQPGANAGADIRRQSATATATASTSPATTAPGWTGAGNF